MKQLLDLDLTADKAEVSRLIDEFYHRQIEHRHKLGPLYAAKERMARARRIGDHTPGWLDQEAQERGISAEDLADLVVTRADERRSELMQMDEQRRAAKRELAGATSGQQVAAIRNRHT